MSRREYLFHWTTICGLVPLSKSIRQTNGIISKWIAFFCLPMTFLLLNLFFCHVRFTLELKPTLQVMQMGSAQLSKNWTLTHFRACIDVEHNTDVHFRICFSLFIEAKLQTSRNQGKTRFLFSRERRQESRDTEKEYLNQYSVTNNKSSLETRSNIYSLSPLRWFWSGIGRRINGSGGRKIRAGSIFIALTGKGAHV
jgi:hypothetical protein